MLYFVYFTSCSDAKYLKREISFSWQKGDIFEKAVKCEKQPYCKLTWSYRWKKKYLLARNIASNFCTKIT